jgi:hypothetical protein
MARMQKRDVECPLPSRMGYVKNSDPQIPASVDRPVDWGPPAHVHTICRPPANTGGRYTGASFIEGNRKKQPPLARAQGGHRLVQNNHLRGAANRRGWAKILSAFAASIGNRANGGADPGENAIAPSKLCYQHPIQRINLRQNPRKKRPRTKPPACGSYVLRLFNVE